MGNIYDSIGDGGTAVADPPNVYDAIPTQAKNVYDDLPSTTAPEVDPKSIGDTRQFLTKSDPNALSPFVGESASLANESVHTQEDMTKALTEPLAGKIPYATAKLERIADTVGKFLPIGITSVIPASSAERALVDTANFFQSPAGVATAAAGAIPKIGTAIGVGFAAKGAKDLPQSIIDYSQAKTDEEKTATGSTVLENLLMLTPIVHGREAAPARPAGASQLDINTVLRERISPTPNAEIPNEILDPLIVAKDVAQKALDKDPQNDGIRNIRDHIDQRLAAVPEERINDGRTRIAQQAEPTIQPTTPEPAVVPGASPPIQGGRSSLFSQAAREAGVPEPTISEVAPESAAAVEAAVPPDEASRVKAHEQAYALSDQISNDVAKGQHSNVVEAARDAAYRNAAASIYKTGQFNPDFMRKSAMDAAGKAAEKLGVSLDMTEGDKQSLLESTPSEEPTPAEAAQKKEYSDKAVEVLGGLQERDSEIVRRHAMEGHTFSEIAADLGVSPQAVQKSYAKALETMRSKMSEAGYAGGPGAMGPVEALEMAGKQGTTSLKRAVVDLQRKASGKEEIPVPERANSKQLISDAEDRITNDETIGKTVVDRINAAEVSGQRVSPEDAAVLLVERTRLRNEQKAWDERAGDKNTPEIERATAREKAQEIENQIDQIDQASRKAGTAWSDFGRLYQQTLRDDFTVEALQRRYKAAKGRGLEPEERAKIEAEAAEHKVAADEYDRLKKLAQEGAAHEEMSRVYEEVIKGLEKENAKTAGISKPVLDIARGIIDRWKISADKSRVELRKKLANLGSAPDPTIILHFANIMLEHVGEIGLKSAEVTARVLEEFGPKAKPFLKSAWEKTKQLIRAEKATNEVKEVVKKGVPKTEKTEAQFKARAKAESKAGEPINGNTVADLVRAKVKAGLHGEDEVMAAVHKDIQEAYPDATEKDVRRALVNYGAEVKAPTKDAVETRVRQLKALVKVEEDIRNLKEGEPTWKSQIRDKRTQELREKVKIRTELLKKVGIPETPESLASRDQAKQTALKNAIEDLDKQLRTGEKPVKGEPVPDSAKTEQLRAERDAMAEKLKEIQDAAKPKPSDQDIAAKKAQEGVDRAAAALDRQQRINSGEIKPEPNEKAQPLSDLEKELRDQTEELRKAKREAEAKSPTERYNETRMKQVQKQLDEANRRIREGDYSPKPKPTPKEKFAEVAHAEAELANVKQQIKQNIEQIRYNNRSIPRQTIDAFKNALRFLTAVKIIGHGTVGMMTHAGGLAFRPSKMAIYWRNFGRQWGMWANKAFHEQLIYQLKNDPDYAMWKKAGASIDPYHTYTDYGMYAKWIGKLTAGGQRGFDALKLTRLEMNKSDWAKVPEEIKSNPEAAAETQKYIAELNNKATGAIAKGNEGINQIVRHPAADAAFFAPKLYATRWSRVLLDPIKTATTYLDWKAASTAERFAANKRVKNAAEFAATYVAALATNQAILSATGSDQKINFLDPTKADWLKFKGAGKEVVADGGLLDPVRLLGQVVIGDLIKNRTQNEQYRDGSRYEKVTHDLAKYARSKLNPTFGLITDVTTRSDFQGRPLPFSKDAPKYKDQPKYNWDEWIAQQGPIPISGGVKIAYDEMRKQGMSKLQIMHILKGAAVGAVGTTGVHVTEDHPKK